MFLFEFWSQNEYLYSAKMLTTILWICGYFGVILVTFWSREALWDFRVPFSELLGTKDIKKLEN